MRSSLTKIAALGCLSSTVVSQATDAYSAAVHCACDQLTALDNSTTLARNTTTYDVERINFWDVRADLSPGCIVMPTSADQVAKAIVILNSCNTQFAIRGGGHMNGGLLRSIEEL